MWGRLQPGFSLASACAGLQSRFALGQRICTLPPPSFRVPEAYGTAGNSIPYISFVPGSPLSVRSIRYSKEPEPLTVAFPKRARLSSVVATDDLHTDRIHGEGTTPVIS